MATAANLEQAAGQAYENLAAKWLVNNLKAALTSFWTTALPTFLDQDVTGRPIANWLTVIAALAQTTPATNVEIANLTEAATDVYKVCWLAFTLAASGQITSAQATALLAAYNAAF